MPKDRRVATVTTRGLVAEPGVPPPLPPPLLPPLPHRLPDDKPPKSPAVDDDEDAPCCAPLPVPPNAGPLLK